MSGVAPRPPAHPWLSPRAVTATAVLLVLIHFALAVGSKLRESTTSDELVHLTAGASYWVNDDYRLQPENGILPQRWAALPAWITGAKFPELTGNVYWQKSDVWNVGYQFFYAGKNDHFPMLMAGRAMVALFSAATGWLVFCWARALFGDRGALVSLTLFAFCPMMLAHGALVTSDACAAFFLLAAVGAWWRHLHDGRSSLWWLSAATVGLAFVAKYSAILLPPMMAVVGLVRTFSPRPLAFAGRIYERPVPKLAAILASAAGHALVAALIIWACYGFRFSAFGPAVPPADHFIRPWEFMAVRLGASGRAIHALVEAHLLPEAYLYGLAYVLVTASSRAAFLNGEFSAVGWVTFFPWTVLLKSTLPVLLASGAILFKIALAPVQLPGWRRRLYDFTPLLLFFVLYWAASLTSKLNIGHRHLLPIYPILFIAAGALGSWVTSARSFRTWLVAALCAGQVAVAACAWPHYLAYFNPLGGGSAQGWRHLVDSSLDWGQDLPGLKRWLETNAANEPVFLSYFGTGEPDYYGIKAERLPFFNNFDRMNPWYVPRAGIYCISATMLQQVYSPFQGAWRSEWEKLYQQERAKEPLFQNYWADRHVRYEVQQVGAAAAFEETWHRYDQLRLARLCAYLRLRRPEANVGYSILIYRLTAAEVAAATTGQLSEWPALLEPMAPGSP